ARIRRDPRRYRQQRSAPLHSPRYELPQHKPADQSDQPDRVPENAPRGPDGPIRLQPVRCGQRPKGPSCLAKPFANALTAQQRAPPVFVVQVPFDSTPEPLFDRDRGAPTQFGTDAGRVDRIAAVVTWPVGNKGDQPVMRRGFWAQMVHMGANGPHQIYITRLILATDVIAAAQAALLQGTQQRVGVILDIKPVAHVASITIDWDRSAMQS